ncbi:MAG: hypothetical protein MUC97_16010 [Bernardetiaceae bacterium]|jgi:hypothetical protein|nr:hypothetical protein [Bernardetiaceae bacterium]
MKRSGLQNSLPGWALVGWLALVGLWALACLGTGLSMPNGRAITEEPTLDNEHAWPQLAAPADLGEETAYHRAVKPLKKKLKRKFQAFNGWHSLFKPAHFLRHRFAINWPNLSGSSAFSRLYLLYCVWLI